MASVILAWLWSVKLRAWRWRTSLIIRRFSHGKMYDAVLLKATQRTKRRNTLKRLLLWLKVLSHLHRLVLFWNRWFVLNRFPYFPWVALCPQCIMNEWKMKVCCEGTANWTLCCLNGIEPRPPLPRGPFLVVFFHNRLQLLGLHMWMWIEPKGKHLAYASELLRCESTLNLEWMALCPARPVRLACYVTVWNAWGPCLNPVSSHFWILAHWAVHSCCSSEMILCDVSSSLRVHRSSAASGVRYPFTTSLREWVTHKRRINNKAVQCKQVNTVAQWVTRSQENEGFWKNQLTQWTTRRESLTGKRHPWWDMDSATDWRARSLMFSKWISNRWKALETRLRGRLLSGRWMLHLWGARV